MKTILGAFFVVVVSIVCSVACSAVEKYAFQLEPDFVCNVAKCAEDSYKPLRELQQDQSLKLFFENSLDTEEALGGFVKKVDDSLVVAFHGVRTAKSDLKSHDRKIGHMVGGDDGGYKDVVAPLVADFDTHHEFSKEVMSYYADIMNIINENEFEQLIFTGNGMGAAIAQLFALRYCIEESSRDLQNKVKVFAFNSPGVFNREATRVYRRAFGDYNSIHMYENLDPITLGPEYCVGIQAYLYLFNRKGVVRTIWEIICSLCRLAFIGVGIDTGCAMDFSTSDIEEVLQRIQRNYLIGPYMGWDFLGSI